MSNKPDDNPFSSLFETSGNQAKMFTPGEDKVGDMNKESEPMESLEVSDLLERIFLLSVATDVVAEGRKSSVPPCCTFMTEFMNDDSRILPEDLERMVFDRLLLSDLEGRLVVRHEGVVSVDQSDATEQHPISYLWACYERMLYQDQKVDASLRKTVALARKVIVQNISNILLNPELTYGLYELVPSLTKLHRQLFIIVDQSMDYKKGSSFHCLMSDLSGIVENKEEAYRMLQPFFEVLCNAISEISIEDFQLQKYVGLLSSMSLCEKISPSIMMHRHNTNKIMDNLRPKSMKAIPAFLLEKTCLYTGESGQHHFYDMSIGGRPSSDDDRVHTLLDNFHRNMFDMFRNFLRKSQTKVLFLTWVGDLMKEHAYAAKLWTHEQANHLQSVFHTDAIFLNLASILVRLALPFCVRQDGAANEKWLKIDPTYCVATGTSDHLSRGVHMQGLDKETCIVSTSDESANSVEVSSSYNFISECFFLTHRSLYLGMHGLLAKFYRLNRDLNQLQNMYRDAMEGVADSDTVDRIKSRFERAMIVYLSTKGTLSEPEFLSNFTLFQLTTARYMNHIAYTVDRSKIVPIPLPLTDSSPQSLKSLPEFIVENVVDFLLFLKRFVPASLENFVRSSSYLLILISIFMGNQSRMSNPHLRASLAEVLEAILPIKDDMGEDFGDDENEISINAIDGFDNVGDLTESVFQLFVDIEFTGDPHQFEQKFNYRRPLYSILKFLWGDHRGRDAVKRLSLASIQDIEAASPPLMLRFINLFLNDAVFLLDEAIDYLTKIKSEEKDRDDGKWNELSAQEKAEKEKGYKQMVQICRYHNVMSNKTVETFAYMSTEKEVTQLLCHSVLVNRISGMLNYFLEHLVGPKMGALKVNDFSHCEFKPKELVRGICKIYVNLGNNTDFCRAVSQDGRSYSRELFPRTVHILEKINSYDLVPDINKISVKALEFIDEATNEEELFEDAPSDFFDPITSTLMRDPVVLPSSNVTVDRSTIARHLLSDHTDPFNRSPLTMEQVTSNTDLVQQMEEWLKEKKKSLK